MRLRSILLVVATSIAILFIVFEFRSALVQAQATDALTGIVTSAEEGVMEGVLVSAKKAGSTITLTVVSDKDGRYSFSASRLEPGSYALHIRAIGYDLDDSK